MSKIKPRVRFCWVCSGLLRDAACTEMEVEGHMRVMHVTCCEAELRENEYGITARPRSYADRDGD